MGNWFCFLHNLETFWIYFLRLDKALRVGGAYTIHSYLVFTNTARKVSKFRTGKWNVARTDAINICQGQGQGQWSF